MLIRGLVGVAGVAGIGGEKRGKLTNWKLNKI